MEKDKQKGFTLIELIIAIAILIILTGLLAPQFMKHIEKARRAKMLQRMDAVYETLVVSYIEATEESKNQYVSGVIVITQGKALGEGEIDQTIANKMGEYLGDDMKNITIWINSNENVDIDYELGQMFIYYYPDFENSPTHYYYYQKGMKGFKGNYGEKNNGEEIWYQ